MNHPSSETWVAYVYGELPPAAIENAEAHVRVCSTCKQSVERLRATLSALDQDKASLRLPRRRSATPRWAPVARWALAASVMLVAGFLAGRLSGPSQADLKREIAAVRQELQTQFQQDLNSMASAAVDAASQEQRRLIAGWVQEVRSGFVADRREMLAALEAFEQRRALDTEALRTGLLLLARSTGTGFQQTESQLNLLASYLPAEASAESPSPSLPTPP